MSTSRPANGYALVKHIQQQSNNLLQVEEGSLYPAAAAQGGPCGLKNLINLTYTPAAQYNGNERRQLQLERRFAN